MRISERQKRFCEFYCGAAQGSAQKAALMAGYSANYARSKSYKLLNSEDIRAYIEELNREKVDKNIATMEDIQTFWSSVMRDEKAKASARLKASELLAKCKGGFNNDW